MQVREITGSRGIFQTAPIMLDLGRKEKRCVMSAPSRASTSAVSGKRLRDRALAGDELLKRSHDRGFLVASVDQIGASWLGQLTAGARIHRSQKSKTIPQSYSLFA